MKRNNKVHDANSIYQSALCLVWMRDRRGDRQRHLGRRALGSGHVLTRIAVLSRLILALALSACTRGEDEEGGQEQGRLMLGLLINKYQK